MGFTRIYWANGLCPNPYYLGGVSPGRESVLVEHIVGEYEPWFQRTANDAAFVAHVVQI